MNYAMNTHPGDGFARSQARYLAIGERSDAPHSLLVPRAREFDKGSQWTDKQNLHPNQAD